MVNDSRFSKLNKRLWLRFGLGLRGCMASLIPETWQPMMLSGALHLAQFRRDHSRRGGGVNISRRHRSSEVHLL